MSIPATLRYTESHEWIRKEPGQHPDHRHVPSMRKAHSATSSSSNCRKPAVK